LIVCGSQLDSSLQDSDQIRVTRGACRAQFQENIGR